MVRVRAQHQVLPQKEAAIIAGSAFKKEQIFVVLVE
jgi:hypothetical protein